MARLVQGVSNNQRSRTSNHAARRSPCAQVHPRRYNGHVPWMTLRLQEAAIEAGLTELEAQREEGKLSTMRDNLDRIKNQIDPAAEI